MAQLDGVLPVIGAVADVADEDILVTAAERYSVLRRLLRDSSPPSTSGRTRRTIRAGRRRSSPGDGSRRHSRAAQTAAVVVSAAAVAQADLRTAWRTGGFTKRRSSPRSVRS